MQSRSLPQIQTIQRSAFVESCKRCRKYYNWLEMEALEEAENEIKRDIEGRKLLWIRLIRV
jgi:ribosomal protein L16/L10AE